MGQLVDYKYYYVLSTTVELRNKKITERQTCAPPDESRIAGWGREGAGGAWLDCRGMMVLETEVYTTWHGLPRNFFVRVRYLVRWIDLPVVGTDDLL